MAPRSSARKGGIAAVAHYLPACSITPDSLRAAWGGGGARDISALTIADIHEDALTMAATAAQRVLALARIRPSAIGGVRLVVPLGSEVPASTLAEALDLNVAPWQTI